MSSDFLREIAQYKLECLARKQAYYEDLKKKIRMGRHGSFKKAISSPGKINLIAEIKKASPSAGVIRQDFNVKNIAETYVKNGAAAISVLTEDKYFLGSPGYLCEITSHFDIPVLMKDFIVHENQVYEALFHEACAVLLIVRMLEQKKLKELINLAQAWGLDCLVEVHDKEEINRALSAGATIIGVNNRNLQTLKVDLRTSLKLIPRIPKGIVIVAESGLQTHEDVLAVQEAGAHAVLMGEVFMRAADIGAKIKEVGWAHRLRLCEG